MTLALIYQRERSGTTGMYFERACANLGVSYQAWSLKDAASIPSGLTCYLRIDHGDDYETALPRHLRPAVFYAIDTHLPHSFKKIRRTASWYDLLIGCHRQATRELPGMAWIPLACDPDVHRMTGEPRTVDVGFVGTDGGVPRKFLLQALRERFPRSVIGAAGYQQISSVYSRARIGFNYAVADDLNMRAFEVPSCGALLVTNALSRNDFDVLGFEDRRHLVCYHTPAQAFELIEYYLTHAAEAEAIAQAGHQLVVTRHTYAARMRQLFTVLQERFGVTVPITAGDLCASS